MKPEETRTGMDFGLQAPVLEAIDMDEPVRVHLAKHYLLLKKTYRLESKSWQKIYLQLGEFDWSSTSMGSPYSF